MSKLKRLVSLLVIFSMLICSYSTFADDGNVEITFYVGDETLTINGTPVTVEKPYVVGEGVTLVPLRVITEAFGAKVDWDGETKTITLTYPEVSIILQINNPIAEVNGNTETLLAAPELSGNYTMVPLRFISETFGAEVSYDEATKKITVIKEMSQSGDLITGSIDSARIGDSYYNWSIDNPKDMQMDSREFDGTYTSFENENGFFYILIDSVPDDYDFEKDFVDTKASLNGSTLVKAEKNTDDPDKKTMHFQAKSQATMLNFRVVITTDYSYVIYGIFDLEDSAAKDESLRIMNTFDLKFDSADTYDLSNVKEGFRNFEIEDLNISFNIPQDYYCSSSDDSVNIFEFDSMKSDDNISSIKFAVYSKSDAGDAKTLAEKDFNGNKTILNEEIVSFSESVRQNTYTNISVYEYDFTINYTAGTEYSRDVFFEMGDYTYNMNISVKMPMKNADEYMDSIYNSILLETIDADKVGILLRNYPESTSTFAMTMEDATLELPNTYQVEEGNPALLYNLGSGTMMSFQKVQGIRGTSFNDAVKNMEDIIKSAALQSNYEVVEKATIDTIGKYKFVSSTVKNIEDAGATYTQQFAMCKNNAIYVFIVSYPEVLYSESNRQGVIDVIKTLDFK